MSRRPLLLVPIETQVREMHAKILLACFAAEAGFSVLIGMQSELLRRAKYLPRGIYVEKGVAPPKLPGTSLLKDLGYKVTAWCEEGLVIVDQETYARDRVSAEVFSMLDAFYAWGKVQAGAIAMKMGDQAKKTVIAGNPRFDLLREPYQSIFHKEADALRKAHGRFILVNTNFGLYNNFYGPKYFIEHIMRDNGRIINEVHEKFLQDWVDHVGAVYESFKDLLPELSKAFPKHKIVLRPHPSENHENWHEAVRGLNNVEVIHKGNVIPWLLASEALIHNSCTTGVEAHVLGKPVVAYRPVLSDIYEYELPRVVSISAFTPQETVDVVSRILKGEEMAAPESSLGKDYAANIDGPFACRTITDSLARLLLDSPFEKRSPVKALGAMLRWKVKDSVYDFKVAVNKILNRKQSDAEYMKQKVPGITLDDVRSAVADLQECSGDFCRVQVERLEKTDYCFRISRKD
ncbi:surface carbohydrate biosynthesis protein [Desulfatibacillum aliphaticivorans]|uniref:surface carbohydrate biosynthesis protein n=1 Tax=Desulfatibacillum aliphaticivorans TaxID=218208 RepID=UPI0003FC2280|nr:surface carbohydrate biosynthesis protein [Desulfatibacillum aliphaticivorans]